MHLVFKELLGLEINCNTGQCLIVAFIFIPQKRLNDKMSGCQDLADSLYCSLQNIFVYRLGHSLYNKTDKEKKMSVDI